MLTYILESVLEKEIDFYSWEWLSNFSCSLVFIMLRTAIGLQRLRNVECDKRTVVKD
jgi:hypothetical protein